MNERIKELAEAAGFNHMGIGLIIGIEEYHQKFAMLIIGQCLNQCYNRGMNDALYAGQLQAAAYIEEFFGVEE